MAKSDADRGPVAAWMRRERLERGWTTHDVAERIGITEPSYRGYEAGPRVSAPVRRALEKLYKKAAPSPQAQQPSDIADLVVALREQTAAINALVERLPAASPDAEALARQLGEALAIHLAPLLAGRGELQQTGSQ